MEDSSEEWEVVEVGVVRSFLDFHVRDAHGGEVSDDVLDSDLIVAYRHRLPATHGR